MASAGTPYRLVPANFYPWLTNFDGKHVKMQQQCTSWHIASATREPVKYMWHRLKPNGSRHMLHYTCNTLTAWSIYRNQFQFHSETGFTFRCFTAQMDHVTVVNVNKHMAVQTGSHSKSTSYVPSSYKQYCCRSEWCHHFVAIFFADFYVVIFIIMLSKFAVSSVKPVKSRLMMVSPDTRNWFPFRKWIRRFHWNWNWNPFQFWQMDHALRAYVHTYNTIQTYIAYRHVVYHKA